MKKLIDYIENANYYEKEFAEWKAFEQIIDEDKAFWMLKKPGSQCQKVCLYRDGYNMFVYGDYGQFSFDSMTWIGSVYNLEYDNIGYQMEKLNYESKESLIVFDEHKCEKDIINWLKYQLKENYILKDDEIEKVVDFIRDIPFDRELYEFCNGNNPFFDIEDILKFTKKCFENAEEYEWVSFLRKNYNKLYDFEDPCESWLWDAGKCIHQRYFICMYALQVCGEKLKEQSGE